MGRLLDVDWEELRQAATGFQSQATSLKDINKLFTETTDSINLSWKGIDADKFKASTEDIKTSIEEEVAYLDSWYNFLMKSSEKYNGNVESFLMKLNEFHL